VSEKTARTARRAEAEWGSWGPTSDGEGGLRGQSPPDSQRHMAWDEMAVVGRIARAHGNRGQVIVNPETDFPETRFQPGAELFVERHGRVESLTLTEVRFHKDRPVVSIVGVETMDDAEGLAGFELRVPLDRLASLPPGTFYCHDLIGCQVVTAGNEVVGTVRSVDRTGDLSQLVVGKNGGRSEEILIPLVADICRTVDPEAKRIVIDPPEGLLELNRTR
jgi:16S rRNA processing protein RimM